MESGKFESVGGGMYSLMKTSKNGWEESVFGIEHELGKGVWVFNNEGKPVLDLNEIKQFRDILNTIIETEENYRKIKF